MKLTQTVNMAAAEPFMLLGGLAGAIGFFALCGWTQSKFGWYWHHILVTAPFFLFWIVVCETEASTGDATKAFVYAVLAMIPFAILWVVRFRIPVTTEWWERGVQ